MNFSSCCDHSWIKMTAIFSSLTFEFEYFFFCWLLSLQHKTLVPWYRTNYSDNIRTNRTTITRKWKWEEKQLYEYFKWQTAKISYEETWTWLWKGNFKRETKSLLIATQNNTIMSNYIKMIINNTQQNCKCKSYRDWDETINHIISICCKLV